MNANLGKYSGYAYALLRIILGLLFACHGGQKLLGFPPGGHGAGEGLMFVGAAIELVAGLLIAFGLVTRVAAFIASGQMAYAYFFLHASGVIAAKMGKALVTTEQHFFPILNGGEPALLYCVAFFYIFFRGGGPLSLDGLIRGRTAAAPGAIGEPIRTGRDL